MAITKLEKLALERIKNIAFEAGMIVYGFKSVDQNSNEYKTAKRNISEIENLADAILSNKD